MRKLNAYVVVCLLMVAGYHIALSAEEYTSPDQNGRYVRLLLHKRNDRMAELCRVSSNLVHEVYVDFQVCRRDGDEEKSYAVTIGIASGVVSVALQRIDIVRALANSENECWHIAATNYVASVDEGDISLLKDISHNSKYLSISGVSQRTPVRVSTYDSVGGMNVGWFDVQARLDSPLSLLDSRGENGPKLKRCLTLYNELKTFVNQSVEGFEGQTPLNMSH